MRVGRAPGVRPQPARVARELALTLEIQEEIDREGLTFRAAARRHDCSRMRICRLLALARLAPDIQARVADLTTTTALEALTVEDLRWVAEAIDRGAQRRRLRQIVGSRAGRLHERRRSTLAGLRPTRGRPRSGAVSAARAGVRASLSASCPDRTLADSPRLRASTMPAYSPAHVHRKPPPDSG